jgi:hypothetical protein
MKTFLLISLCVALNSQVFAQNVLLLENSSNGKKREIKSGAKIYFKSTSDSAFVKGKIVQLKDTSVVIFCPDYEAEMSLVDIKLKDITVIKKATTFHSISRSLGSVFLPIGTFLALNGIITLARDSEFQGVKTYDEDAAKTRSVIGGAFIVAGVIPFIIKPKVYDFSKNWKLSVRAKTN